MADHYSLSLTTIYSNHADPHLKELIREKAPGFTSDKATVSESMMKAEITKPPAFLNVCTMSLKNK